jgi:hypothetical protein
VVVISEAEATTGASGNGACIIKIIKIEMASERAACSREAAEIDAVAVCINSKGNNSLTVLEVFPMALEAHLAVHLALVGCRLSILTI